MAYTPVPRPRHRPRAIPPVAGAACARRAGWRSGAASGGAAAPAGRGQCRQTVGFAVDKPVLVLCRFFGADRRIVGQNDAQRVVAQQLADMLVTSGMVFQGEFRGQAAEQVGMERGAHTFCHGINDGFPDLTVGQRSGFSIAGRKQPLFRRLIRRGRGEERQEVFQVESQELAEPWADKELELPVVLRLVCLKAQRGGFQTGAGVNASRELVCGIRAPWVLPGRSIDRRRPR